MCLGGGCFQRMSFFRFSELPKDGRGVKEGPDPGPPLPVRSARTYPLPRWAEFEIL